MQVAQTKALHILQHVQESPKYLTTCSTHRFMMCIPVTKAAAAAKVACPQRATSIVGVNQRRINFLERGNLVNSHKNSHALTHTVTLARMDTLAHTHDWRGEKEARRESWRGGVRVARKGQ